MVFIITQFSEFLKQMTTIPDFQRIINKYHLETIIKKYEQSYFETKLINYYGAIILCEYNGVRYLIDGQHRFFALKHMFEKYNIDISIMLQILPCKTNKEMKEHFKNINSNLELPDYLLELESNEKKQNLQKFEQYLMKTYNNYHSNSQHPRFPNVNFILWTNSYFYERLSNINSNSLETYLNIFNKENDEMKEYFQENDIDKFNQIIKKSKDKQYFFLSNIFKKPQKTKISSKLRNDVWNKYIGKEIGLSNCLCCKLNIIEKGSSFYHCGHVISEKNGGKTNIENLKPICSDCNLSMNSTNMDEFIKINGY